jgi:phytanoyl-CoA hydroxylase
MSPALSPDATTIAERQARNRAAAQALIDNPPPQHPCVALPPPSESKVTPDGEAYAVSAADRAAFAKNGFVVLRQVLTDEEMKRDLDPCFFGFFRGEPGCVAPGLDTCDMGLPPPPPPAAAGNCDADADDAGGNGNGGNGGNGKNGTPSATAPLAADQCALFNVMLPRLYYAGDQGPRLVGSVLERRCASIAEQLRGGPGGGVVAVVGGGGEDEEQQQQQQQKKRVTARFAVDFDQILSKRPEKAVGGGRSAADSGRSQFGWHQDAAYWPPLEEQEQEGAAAADAAAGEGAPAAHNPFASLNCWLCVSPQATEQHGCMRYLPGTHLEPQLRRHVPVAESRAASHAIHVAPAHLFPPDGVERGTVAAPARRGDLVVHHERVLHCSPANQTAEWRHAYVLGMRTPAAIAAERRAGFAHTHNGAQQWDSFGGGGDP